ncbi:unnamed protein product [Amaranthus hypochondriacus]
MRGGRGSRGRGGRGSGEDQRTQGVVTCSGAEKSEARDYTEGMSDFSSISKGAPQASPQVIEEDDDESNSEEGESNLELKKELREVKTQLAALIQNLGQMKNNPNCSIEERTQTETSSGPTIEEVEFPALRNGSKAVSINPEVLARPMISWKDKVSIPKTPIGMPLKFVPPIIEKGIQVVHIESHDVADLIRLWECAVVVYVVGGNVSADIIRGFIRKHWSYVSMPTIHTHEDGYFIFRFNTEEECSEILKGGPYFLNRAPMIVKKWNSNFDFKEEILRVIPVWIRLPSLPLHCWGEETLRRIVSAIGVPVLADECTAKQSKVSYARVLVEVDITHEFVKEIKVRDNMGREFVQKAIPEWRPYFCSKCNKIGHDCKATIEPIKPQQLKKHQEVGKDQEEKRMWIPSTIAKMMQGITCLGDLRTKLATVNDPHDNMTIGIKTDNHDAGENDQDEGANTANHDAGGNILLPTDEQPLVQPSKPPDSRTITTQPGGEDEGGWTTVSSKKSARRTTPTQTIRTSMQGDSHHDSDLIRGIDENQSAATIEFDRDGNPQIPSLQ